MNLHNSQVSSLREKSAPPPKVVALLPMKGTSERIPGKNYRLFNGKPLYHHILETLLSCPEVSKVVIDTDSSEILEKTARFFPQVQLIVRPEHLRSGLTPTNDILLHDTTVVDSEFYLQTHCTNPLLKSETISQAIEHFFAHYPKHDSLFSVTRVFSRFWDAQGKAVNHDPDVLLRTQDLPPFYEENSCIYLFPKTVIQNRRNRLGAKPLLFEMNPREAADIDVELDFLIAEFMHAKVNHS